MKQQEEDLSVRCSFKHPRDKLINLLPFSSSYLLKRNPGEQGKGNFLTHDSIIGLGSGSVFFLFTGGVGPEETLSAASGPCSMMIGWKQNNFDVD